jgi:hypothetical protein
LGGSRNSLGRSRCSGAASDFAGDFAGDEIAAGLDRPAVERDRDGAAARVDQPWLDIDRGDAVSSAVARCATSTVLGRMTLNIGSCASAAEQAATAAQAASTLAR